MSAPDDLESAARLERAGDAAAAAGEPAATLYRQAQQVLMPPGAHWTDAAQYAGRMEGFQRLQDKLYALGPDGRVRNFVLGQPPARVPGPAAPPPTPAWAQPVAAEVPDQGRTVPAPPAATDADAWLEPALQRRFDAAIDLLRDLPPPVVGMGHYAAEGYAHEDAADNAAADGHAERARLLYVQALRNYLLYSLFPARGDSRWDGIGFAERVLDKLEAPAAHG